MDVGGYQGPCVAAPSAGAARDGIAMKAAAEKETSAAAFGATPAAGDGLARDPLTSWDTALLVWSHRELGEVVDVEVHPFLSCSGLAALAFHSLARGGRGVAWDLC